MFKEGTFNIAVSLLILHILIYLIWRYRPNSYVTNDKKIMYLNCKSLLKMNPINRKKIAVLYTGNIHPKLRDWDTIAQNHIKLLTMLFPSEENQVDIFFVVDETDAKELLSRSYYKQNTANIVCTNTSSSWKKTSVADLGKMNPSRIQEFEDRIRERGFNPKAIINIRNVEQYHKLTIAIKLKKEQEMLSGEIYDKCVRIRPDILFNTDKFEQIKARVSEENYLAHLSDLFFVSSSNMFDSIINILDEIYTIEDEAIIANGFIDRIDGKEWPLRRLFPEVQFVTYVCKYSPKGKYDVSWYIGYPDGCFLWPKYIRIIR